MTAGLTVCSRFAPALIRATALVVALAAHTAAAKIVDVPLRIDNALVQTLIEEQLFTGPGQSLEAYRDASGCSRVTLTDPRLVGTPGLLRVRSRARATFGAAMGGQCMTLLEWSGGVETDAFVELDRAAQRITIRAADSRLYDNDGRPADVAGPAWDLVKDQVHPRLDSLDLNLRQALADVRATLPTLLRLRETERTRRILDSVALDSVVVDARAIVFTAQLDVPEIPPVPPEPPLSEAELAAWQDAWQRWDAFLTYVVKYTAQNSAAEELRAALSDVLLDARYDIITILSESPTGPDPVPRLFLQTWSRLAPALRQLQPGLPGEQALRYLSFIAAADALASIEALGPGSGIDLSADGLRRLARIIAPLDPADPLFRDDAVDAELRRLMGFGPPIAAPQADGGAHWLDFFLRPAYAVPQLDPLLVVKLNLWVPDRRNIDGYLPLANRLLVQTADLTMVAEQDLAEAHRNLFRDLVRATAWKESCWRQFERSRGEVKALTSSIGALGMMQVNPAAWRGFYEVGGLAGDIGYNARAGADILAHYLTHYAIRKGEHKKSVPDALVRATYAAYNGGPSHLRRYRRDNTKRSLKQIDASFYRMYKAIQANDIAAVGTCYRG